MGKVVEKTRKKKKKGRPSLIDLQKRSLKEQQQLQRHQKQKSHQNKKFNPAPNYQPATPNPVRRSARRNPNPDEDEKDDELGEKRCYNMLNVVDKLPPQVSPANSVSFNGGGEELNDEDRSKAFGNKKRKIDSVKDGSGADDAEKVEERASGASTDRGNELDLGPSTPLPDKKLLLFILDRLQKKDTYGVFLESVDPEELPDYHEIIEHPMDFGTIRKKLEGGNYANLEQFEKDIFLISSNAMQYNAPDTIYFRQARSIEQLAKKSFENLRQSSDDDVEPERKIVRRGRPPTKNVKKTPGRPPLDHVGSDINSSTALPSGEERRALFNNDRRGPLLEESINNEAYEGWLTVNKYDRNDGLTGSMWEGNLVKHGKKQFVYDENRRNTYMKFEPHAGERNPFILATFDRDRKQLMAVGLFSEYGYARSLARFAANLGPVVWKIASKKIERSLPGGVTFGPGRVGENDVAQRSSSLVGRDLTGQLSMSNHFPIAASSSSAIRTCNNESKVEVSGKPGDNILEKKVSSENNLSERLEVLSTEAISPLRSSRTIKSSTASKEPEGSSSHGSPSTVHGTVGVKEMNPDYHSHPDPLVHPCMNGFNGFKFPPRMKHGTTLPSPGSKALTASPSGLNPVQSWLGPKQQQKSESVVLPQQATNSVQPDLSFRFGSPGSQRYGKVTSVQADLALQL